MNLPFLLQGVVNTTETAVMIENEMGTIQEVADMNMLDMAFKGGWIMIVDRKRTRLNSSPIQQARMLPSA